MRITKRIIYLLGIWRRVLLRTNLVNPRRKYLIEFLASMIRERQRGMERERCSVSSDKGLQGVEGEEER